MFQGTTEFPLTETVITKLHGYRRNSGKRKWTKNEPISFCCSKARELVREWLRAEDILLNGLTPQSTSVYARELFSL